MFSSGIGFPKWGSIRACRILFAIRLELFFGDGLIVIAIGWQNEFADEGSDFSLDELAIPVFVKFYKDFFNRWWTVWSASGRSLDCAARLVAILVASM